MGPSGESEEEQKLDRENEELKAQKKAKNLQAQKDALLTMKGARSGFSLANNNSNQGGDLLGGQ